MENKFERYKNNLGRRIELSREILQIAEFMAFDLRYTETPNTVDVSIHELKLGIENMQHLLKLLQTFINEIESNE